MSEKRKNKVAFMGSGSFSEPVFDVFTDTFKNTSLITKGTSNIIRTAKNKNIKTYQIDDKNELANIINEINPQIIIVVSFGYILTSKVLEYPEYGSINVHASLLPLLRGASPITQAILNGDAKTGITIQKMVEKLDTGDILFQKEVDIDNREDKNSLEKKLINITNDNLVDITTNIISGNITPIKQDENKASYTKITKKEDGHIDWSHTKEAIDRMVRAYTPWPSAYTYWGGKLLKIIESELGRKTLGEQKGTFVNIDKNKYGIETGNGILIIKKIQLEGKKSLPTESFILGNSSIVGSTLT